MAQCSAFGLHYQFPTPTAQDSLRAHTQPSLPKQPLPTSQEPSSPCTFPGTWARLLHTQQHTRHVGTAAIGWSGVRQQQAAASCPELKSLALHVCWPHQDLCAYLDFATALIIKHIPNLIVKKSERRALNQWKDCVLSYPGDTTFHDSNGTEEEELLVWGALLLSLRLFSLRWPQTVMWDTDIC